MSTGQLGIRKCVKQLSGTKIAKANKIIVGYFDNEINRTVYLHRSLGRSKTEMMSEEY